MLIKNGNFKKSTRNSMCSDYPMKRTAPGLAKDFEGLSSYISIQGFALGHLQGYSKQIEMPTRTARLPFDGTGTLS
jgi:hypothetical protein